MSKLIWGKVGERLYETGVRYGVFYPRRGVAEAWNGLTSVSENPTGAESNPVYADNIKYLNLFSAEEFAATIEALDCPNGFKKCLGEVEGAKGVTIAQQPRESFAFSYQTNIGNDVEQDDYGYRIHIFFSCNAVGSETAYTTIGDNTEPISHSYEINATPVQVDDRHKPTAVMVIDSVKMSKAGFFNALKGIEDLLYGTDKTDPEKPTISKIMDIFSEKIYLRDSSGNALLDSNGSMLQSSVYR